MEAKNLTIEQCETFEDELTQKAVEYANLIKTPNQRALAAKDVITGLPEKDITLAYKDGYRAQLDQISTEMAQQLVQNRFLVGAEGPIEGDFKMDGDVIFESDGTTIRTTNH